MYRHQDIYTYSGNLYPYHPWDLYICPTWNGWCILVNVGRYTMDFMGLIKNYSNSQYYSFNRRTPADYFYPYQGKWSNLTSITFTNKLDNHLPYEITTINKISRSNWFAPTSSGTLWNPITTEKRMIFDCTCFIILRLFQHTFGTHP